MTDCSLNYEFSARKIRIQNILCKKVVFLFLFWNSKQFLYTISHILNLYFSFTELVIQWTMWCIFCGLADARMSASEKNLPVLVCFRNDFNPFCQPSCAAAAAVYFCCPVLKDTSRNLTSKYQRCYLVIVSGYKKHSNLSKVHVF